MFVEVRIPKELVNGFPRTRIARCEQHAQKILPITDRALIFERGRIVHQSASAALLADRAPLERFLGVTAR